MNENFAPLVPSDLIAKNSTSSGFPPPDGPLGSRDRAFSPLSASLVDRAKVKLDHPSPGVCTKPNVTLCRDGDRVTQIRIQCVCGQVIELDCLY